MRTKREMKKFMAYLLVLVYLFNILAGPLPVLAEGADSVENGGYMVTAADSDGETGDISESGEDDTAGEDEGISRIEWISALVHTFDMQVAEDNYPDNYFSDINSGSEYYYDVMLATEFGLIDVEAGEQFKPDEPATREFASHTLNLCLGYVLEEENYTFSEASGVKYPVDIQVAVNESWFELNNGAFLPNQPITEAEKDGMIAFAKEKIALSE